MKDGGMDGHFLLGVLSQKRIVPLKFAVMEPTLESLFYGGGSVKGYFAFLKKEFFEYTKL